MERIPEFIGNHLFLVSLFAALLVMLLWNLFGAGLTGVQEIEPADATLLINREGGRVVDVRAADEYAAGHILNALNLPLAELESRRGELDKYKDKPVIAVCGNGPMSGRAARQLRGAGFARAVALRGGIAAWQGAHLPLTRSQKI
ncbi:MAG: rhodanese-like domain-containing protein [Gammaproteobacteria bacterium]|nr:rhodanese-like domain-containing protein [Gammaproteobacteria bacterium]